MKNLLKASILSLCIACMGIACSDGTSQATVDPDVIAGGGTQVTRTDLVSALWSEADDVSTDARCLIGSTFEITSETPFTIAMNEDPEDSSESDVIIISPVTIIFDDAASDGRGAGCGEGVLQYEIEASESDPIDIEVAEELEARHSLIHIISNTGGEYPDCTIRGHFDKAGRERCGSGSIIGDINVMPKKPIFRRKPIYEIMDKAQRVSDDGLPCGTTEIQSVKLVVDEHDCSL